MNLKIAAPSMMRSIRIKRLCELIDQRSLNLKGGCAQLNVDPVTKDVINNDICDT